jgi:hypothetical protein
VLRQYQNGIRLRAPVNPLNNKLCYHQGTNAPSGFPVSAAIHSAAKITAAAHPADPLRTHRPGTDVRRWGFPVLVTFAVIGGEHAASPNQCAFQPPVSRYRFLHISLCLVYTRSLSAGILPPLSKDTTTVSNVISYIMPRNHNSEVENPQKHRLTLAQLASYDDVLTDALVDQVGTNRKFSAW